MLDAYVFRATGNAAPEPRVVHAGKTRIVLAGGLLSSNERSGPV